MNVLCLLKGAEDISLADKFKSFGHDVSVVSCVDAHDDFFKFRGYETFSRTEFLSNSPNNHYDLVVGSPLFENGQHLKMFEKSLSVASKVKLILPSNFLFDERPESKYKPLLDKIENHVNNIVVYHSRTLFKKAELKTNVVQISVDMNNKFDNINVNYDYLGISVDVPSIYDLNSFGNYDVYVSFKKKVLDYIEKGKSLEDALQTNPSSKYKIPVSLFCNYYILSGKNKYAHETITTNAIQSGIGFEYYQMAEACFNYFKNPIAILALHIYKKGFNLGGKCRASLPIFDTVEDFLYPEKALNLTEEEVHFANMVYKNSKTYFNF
jgi:hypothetical protein